MARSAQRDPDTLLVEQMLAPPPLDEARSSLEYWMRRRRALPVYRRAARREAKEMATRWQERVAAAERARFESNMVGQALTALGISSLWLRRARLTKRRVLVSGWRLVPRKAKLVLGVVAVTWVLVAGLVIAAAALVVQLG